MKIRPKRVILIATLVTGLILGFHNLTRAFEANIANYPTSPEGELVSFSQKDDSKNIQGRECLSANITNVQLLGEYEDSVALYQLWEYTGENGQAMSATMLFGEACGIAYDPSYGDEMTDRISLTGARSLTVQLLERKIEEVGSIEDFEVQLTESLSSIEGGRPELTSVYVWALRELGVEVSGHLYTVRDIDARAPR